MTSEMHAGFRNVHVKYDAQDLDRQLRYEGNVVATLSPQTGSVLEMF